MERPQADLSYVVEKIPMGPAFPTGQLHDISSGMRTFRPVIDTEKCVKCLRCFPADSGSENPSMSFYPRCCAYV